MQIGSSKGKIFAIFGETKCVGKFLDKKRSEFRKSFQNVQGQTKSN